MKLELGGKVKDNVTELTGIATGVAKKLNGAFEYCITPPINDGKMMNSHWFCSTRLAFKEVVKDKKKPAPRHGPQRNAPERD